MLEKYHWVFVLALEEIKAAAKANGTTGENRYKNTVEMLEGLIAGNTATIGGDYAEGRTAFRFWLEGLMNKKIVGNSDYPFMTDFSVAENLQKFYDVQEGGASMPSQVLEHGTKLPVIEREHYVFVGWFDGETQVETATYEATLVAKWEEIIIPVVKYTITFDVNGGNSLTNSTFTAEAGAVIEFPNPVKDGYEFLGWYIEDEKFEKTTMPEENITLVAKWERNVFQVTFDAGFDYSIDSENNTVKIDRSVIDFPFFIFASVIVF